MEGCENYMRHGLSILVFFMLAASFLGGAGCGHDQIFEPWVIGSGTDREPSDPTDIGGTEIVMPSIYARNAVKGTTWELFASGSPAIRAMGFIILMAEYKLSVDTAFTAVDECDDGDVMRKKHIMIERTQGLGGSMNAEGDVFFVRNLHHCAIFSTMDVHYDSFTVDSSTKVSGDGTVRLIFTSYSCKYFQNIHADIRLEGAFTAGDQIIKEISARIDYEPGEGRDSGVSITSATVATDSTPFQCSDRDGRTVCERSDNPITLNYCASEDGVCEVTPEGHEGCMQLEEYEEETGAHCNMGCCSPQPPEVNTCNGEEFGGRECDPAITPFFTTTYLLWGRNLMTYEVPIRCSDDGLWTLPCSEEFKTCPHGSLCYYPDQTDWGYGFGGYGYCSCLLGN